MKKALLLQTILEGHSTTTSPPMDRSDTDTDEAECHVVAATYHLVKALQTTKNLSNDMRRLLEDLDIHLSTAIKLNDHETEAEQIKELETRLNSAQQIITTRHSTSPVVMSEHLQAVGEVHRLIETLEDLPLKRTKLLLDQATGILQIAMDRLINELIHTLVQNKQCFEQLYEVYPIYEESIVSNEDDDASVKDRSSSETEEYNMDLIHPDVIPQIKSIADTMFTSGYAPEFCKSFTTFWSETFADYSTILDLEHLSIEDVHRMEWKQLNSRIRKWRVAVKQMIGVYLVSAKRIFDQILGEHGQVSSACLIEASKGPLITLLSFGQAVSIAPHQPEWLYCLLDMYEVLSAHIPDLDMLFPREVDFLIRSEFGELLLQLGEAVKVIVKDLGNCIASKRSTTPFPNGGVHPLTKYVVNYILCFSEYGDTLHSLLQDLDRECIDGADTDPDSAVATYLQSLTSVLEANLENRSNLYKDCSIKHIFLMNNIHYMVEKIRNSNISHYFGDDWIRSRFVKFRQHARYYERMTWNSILTFLHDDEKVSKAALKARCRDFNTSFEDLYKSQTRWIVPDAQLREDVHISASKTVIQAYRNFVNKIVNSIGEKHIKYSEQELGVYIFDLLEGSSKSLNHSRKR